MNPQEARLYQMVRGILVRNYADTQKLEVQVIGSTVYIEGELHIFDYHIAHESKERIEYNLSAKRALLHIEQQIRGLAEVTYLEMKMNNWERVGMQWQPKH